MYESRKAGNSYVEPVFSNGGGGQAKLLATLGGFDFLRTLKFSADFGKIYKKGFTLAEVLITLAVIGVVSAITMPTVVANINERANSERQANIAYKITQAMDKMKSLGLLNENYTSTDAFVNELEKHLKIAKRCDADSIANCWPTKTVTTSDGESFEIKNAKTGKLLNLPNNKTNNVGLVLADGASLIISYNENAQTLDIGAPVENKVQKELPIGFGKYKAFPYTTSVTDSIDFVMDVNGRKGPNSENIGDKYYDIRSFNSARFSRCVKVGDYCLLNIGTSYDCISEAPLNNNTNCWAGAKKACTDLGLDLPDKATFSAIWKLKGQPEIPTTSNTSNTFWSSVETPDVYKAYVSYNQGKTWGYVSKNSKSGALCFKKN